MNKHFFCTHNFINFLIAFVIICVTLQPDIAFAHHPMGGMIPDTLWHGFLSGLAHPVIEIDHLAFIIGASMLTLFAVGYRFLLPACLIGGMMLGILIHFSGYTPPFIESFIILSIVIVGVIVMLGRRLSSVFLASGIAFAGMFHGYAYAETVIGAETGVIMSYIVGLSIIQYVVCLLPVVFYFGLKQITELNYSDKNYGRVPFVMGTFIILIAAYEISHSIMGNVSI